MSYRRTFARGTPISAPAQWQCALVGALLLVGAVKKARAQNAESPMFRGGAQHTGAYGTSSYRTLVGLQWRVPTQGDVISSPVVSRGSVYVGSGDGRMYSIDLLTGSVRWATPLGSAVAASPALAGARVVVATRGGSVVALDTATGVVRWRVAMGADRPFAWGHESGDHYVSSPAYVDGLVLVGGGDGFLYAIDAAAGRVRWRAQTGGRIRSSPAVARGRVFVGSQDGIVYCFNVVDGTLNWRYRTQGADLNSADFGFDRRTIQSSPAGADGVVYIGSRDGGLYALDEITGNLKWRADHGTSWIITSPAVADGVVYVGSSDAAFVQALDAVTGAQLWRREIRSVVWSSVAIAGSILYVGDLGGRLHALDRSTGDSLWTFRTGQSVFSSPVVADDLVIFGSSDGALYALRTGSGRPVQRGVFFDSALVRASTVGDPAFLLRYLRNRHYDWLDAVRLPAFLEARIRDGEPSVVVMATDRLPSSVVAQPLQQSLLRRYLDAGGKVVWPGAPPLLWPRDSATGRRAAYGDVDWSAPLHLLDVDHSAAIFDDRGATATEVGRRMGLTGSLRDSWGVRAEDVTEVLALDEWGLATSWLKRYGGPAGTGFVRVPSADPLAIYNVAEFRPRVPCIARDAGRDADP